MEQKELKAIYKEELKKAWSSEKMVDFCTKNAAYIIEHNGELYEIDKPRIHKDFCFGHGMYGITTEEDEKRASDMAQYASESRDYFINENMNRNGITGWIEKLEEIREQMQWNWAENNHPVHMIQTGAHYTGQTEDCKLRYFSVVNTYSERAIGELCEDVELIDKLIAGYKTVQADFTKRLNTYLKKYGLSKVRTWTYLVD